MAPNRKCSAYVGTVYFLHLKADLSAAVIESSLKLVGLVKEHVAAFPFRSENIHIHKMCTCTTSRHNTD